ncbi:hypothetical protein [Synechocystis sp. LKSZ1]|uniref:hypothetical protein n=1 Tax=Synechocystis sp. LKSZ1 TaxID=3144951 RepID=UPI00336BBFD5
MSDSPLILPGDPLFDETLLTPRPDWGEVAAKDGDNYAFVVMPGELLPRPVTMAELNEYLEGGAYDEQMIEMEFELDLD